MRPIPSISPGWRRDAGHGGSRRLAPIPARSYRQQTEFVNARIPDKFGHVQSVNPIRFPELTKAISYGRRSHKFGSKSRIPSELPLGRAESQLLSIAGLPMIEKLSAKERENNLPKGRII